MFLSGCDGCCRSRYNRHIYAAYEWVELLNDKIAEAYADGSKNAVIDMNKLEKIVGENFHAQLIAEYRNRPASDT